MVEWASLATDVLWRNGLAAVPLVVLTTLATKVLPCRPATRHTLWLVVLGWFFVPPVLPEPPREQLAAVVKELPTVWTDLVGPPDVQQTPALSIDTLREALHPLADTIRRASESPAKVSTETSDTRPTSYASKDPVGEASHDKITSTPPSPRSVVRPAMRSPEMLAQATAAGGPLSEVKERNVDPPPSMRVRRPDAEPSWRPDNEETLDFDVDLGISDPVALDDPQQPPALSPPQLEPESTPELTAAIQPTIQPAAPSVPRIERATGDWRTWMAGILDVRDALASLPPLPVEIWAAGTLTLLLLACARMIVFRARLATALPAPQSVVRVVEAASRELGLRQVPSTWMVEGRVSPMIWCGWRPRLVLPTLLWSQLDGVGRRAVVFHELAHVRRRDHWVRWADAFVGSLYWWHPLVWWARRKLHAEAEVCCDAWVTTLMPRARRAYAEALLVTRQYLGSVNQPLPAMGIGVTTGRARRFARRLTMVMTGSIKPRLSVSGIILVLTVATTGWLTTPARSCPDEAKTATLTKAGDKADKPCGKDCAKGCAKGCAKAGAAVAAAPCVSAKAAGTAAVAASAAEAEAKSTYEQHMAAREALATTVAPAISAKVLPLIALASGKGGSSDDRISRLEEELDRLNEKLERLMEAIEHRHEHGDDDDGDETPRPRAPRAPRASAAPHAPGVPQPPMPTMPPMPAMPPMPGMPAAAGADFGPDGGDVSPRVYKLSKGKLEALTALMSRSDVPILIRPLDDGIEVQATPRQHRVFAAFVKMIDPGSESMGALELREGPAIARRQRDEVRQQAKELEKAARERAKAMEKLEKRRSKAGARMEEIRHEVTAKAEMQEALAREAENLSEEAENLAEEAERVREQTEELEREAGRVEERERRADIERHALALRHQAEVIDQQRAHVEDQARAIEDRARQAEEDANEAENRLEELEEELSRLEQEAEEQGDDNGSHASLDQLDEELIEALESHTEEVDSEEGAVESPDEE